MSTNLRQAASAHQLEVMLPESCVLRWPHALLCSVFVGLFLILSYFPVSYPGTWESILQGNAAAFETRVPLSEGIRHFRIGWASDQIIAGLFRTGGAELVSFSFAVLQTIAIITVAAISVQASRRWWAALLMVPAVLASFPSMTGLTSHTFGQVCLAVCVALLMNQFQCERRSIEWRHASVRIWISMALLFIIWANLDASFLVGLGVLALLAVAQVANDMKVGSWRSAFDSVELKQRLLLLEVCGLVTLVNPDGWKLWDALLWATENPVVDSIGGWEPAAMASPLGLMLMIAWAGWMVVARRHKIDAFWVMLPVAGTVLMAINPVYSLWFAPLFALSVAAVAISKNDAVSETHAQPKQQPLKFTFTLICGLILWMGFSFSPWGSTVLGGKPRSQSQLIGSNFPIGLSQYLGERRFRSLVYCPVQWSDWLQTRSDIAVMAGSGTSRLPESVRQDYQAIYEGHPMWNRIAEKYAFDAMIIDKGQQQNLVRQIRRGTPSWRIAFEDQQAIVLTAVAK
ncbi:hypothetical protein LOC67_19510 [Stieleria sp. JC731]|uniref:hypothetical protein n=1 Tax=Pirellulaceae TaxID=2691357 RepID=UPI001E49D84B|nr:hypothetical protein [Stieleria sp. JC731]MCC9602743.1 hypothetical protein [Stieleria sp. JC731]